MYQTLTEVAEVIARRFNDGRGRALGTASQSYCVYVTDDGNRCAVGALIPDDHELATQISSETSGDVEVLITDYPLFRTLFAPEAFDLAFLKQCQIIHDDPNYWGDDGKLSEKGWNEFVDTCLAYVIPLQERSAYAS